MDTVQFSMLFVLEYFKKVVNHITFNQMQFFLQSSVGKEKLHARIIICILESIIE
jgi:hypothetical protein